jgi:mannose-1-phosphate guanylyltransferase/mannose-6-phosphate isomerase
MESTLTRTSTVPSTEPHEASISSAVARRAQPPEVHVDTRPWGSMRRLAVNEPVTVKVISVLPGSRLSLQRHAERGELWEVLDTPMLVTVGERTWTADVGETVWIPCGQTHRLANPSTTVQGRVLEVAWGHFDESDIVREDDDHGRA